MTGAEHARKAVAAYLAAALPHVLAVMADRGQPCRPPRLIAATEQPRVDGSKMPCVIVTRANMSAMREIDRDGTGGQAFLCDYDLQIFTWARGRDTDDTADQVDRLTLGVQEALLGRPTVGAGDVLTFHVIPESFRHRYSDVAPIAGQGEQDQLRHFAGCRLDCVARVEETLIPDTVPFVSHTVDVLPPHPALD